MPQYRYRSAPGLPIRTTYFKGGPQEFADALAEDCRGAYGREPEVRI